MSHILDTIMATKAVEVAQAKECTPLRELERAVAAVDAPCRSLRASLLSHKGGVISEFKRRSPSKDWIKRNAEVAQIIPAYEQAGAAALSILTDTTYFGGSLADVEQARALTSLPILRKEFVLDEYQLFQARAVGADACLLIAAAIGAKRCHELAREAHNIGLEVILEIHAEDELEAYSDHVDVIGVNNRDLRVFRTDTAQSERLFPLLPAEALPISESGLLQAETARRLQQIGYKGFLVGEAFMKAERPGEALKEYLSQLS